MVSKQERYETLLPQARALLEGESDPVARMANLAALIHTTFGFWWTGFYRVCPATDSPGFETADAGHERAADHRENAGQKDTGGETSERHSGEVLLLGPFQGPVACTRIAYGRGVCGTAWKERRTVIVPDVEAFPGHIACSSLSRSEIVVPVFARPAGIHPATSTSAADSLTSGVPTRDAPVVAVLDIDSERLATFDDTDTRYLERIVALL